MSERSFQFFSTLAFVFFWVLLIFLDEIADFLGFSGSKFGVGLAIGAAMMLVWLISSPKVLFRSLQDILSIFRNKRE